MLQRFESTAWSVIVATQGSDSAAVRTGLQAICSRYWLPLYSYIRRKGYTPPEAEDLTQSFFEYLLSCDLLRQVHPARGRFRTYLLACLNHFLLNDIDRKNAAKRGGGVVTIPLDLVRAECQVARLETADVNPQVVFDRQWAEMLLDIANRRLEQEYRDAGKLKHFEVLRGCLGRGDEAVAIPVAAGELGLSEGAVRVAIHRMRRRFAALTRDEIAQTVDGEESIREELNYLIQVMSG